jgi:hypothetical protein
VLFYEIEIKKMQNDYDDFDLGNGLEDDEGNFYQVN